ncbi:PREDICTED: uncharacterized protein LOC108781440 [Cyphomyrmex costatus]|uniref:uncharacterized protein LOC108781440 n=1 Tax=Cyphomyrmex costatus TaxID=456900 RepID=UPI0008523895|nr:PREDICTED: uncharacterized protein LOC108781440 [Cyphomyrmex costatus]
MVIVFFGLILELVEFNESYKIKQYSYHNPPPWRRPRWHSFPKHRKRYHSKRILPHKYHLYEPDYDRYAPYHEDTSDQDKPFVIVIQLPQKNEKKKYDFYQRKHIIDPPQNNDYADDDDEEVKVYQIK